MSTRELFYLLLGPGRTKRCRARTKVKHCIFGRLGPGTEAPWWRSRVRDGGPHQAVLCRMPPPQSSMNDLTLPPHIHPYSLRWSTRHECLSRGTAPCCLRHIRLRRPRSVEVVHRTFDAPGTTRWRKRLHSTASSGRCISGE
jgi:hypothetical protein